MAISAKDVADLRKRTGLGMMECQKALKETDGDMQKAIEYLRERLGKKMEERSDREAMEGAIAVAKNETSVVIVTLKSETDFTAKNQSFIDGAEKVAQLALEQEDGDVQLNDAMNEVIENLRITIKENISLAKGKKFSGAKVGSYVHHNRKVASVLVAEGDIDDELMTGIAQHITAAVPTPLAVDQDGLAQDEVEKQKAEFVEEAKATGKPEEIADKIATGKLRKWVDDQTLLGQNYLRDMDSNKAIREYLPGGSKIASFYREQL